MQKDLGLPGTNAGRDKHGLVSTGIVGKGTDGQTVLAELFKTRHSIIGSITNDIRLAWTTIKVK